MCTDWISRNVGQWLNRSLVQIECFCFAFAIWLCSGWLGSVYWHQKAKSKTQFEPENDSAIGQHLLKSNQCARNYSDSWFKMLTTACSQFHLSLIEAVYISQKKRFVQAKAVQNYPSTVSIRSEPTVAYGLHFFSPLIVQSPQNAFLLTADYISP